MSMGMKHRNMEKIQLVWMPEGTRCESRAITYPLQADFDHSILFCLIVAPYATAEKHENTHGRELEDKNFVL